MIIDHNKHIRDGINKDLQHKSRDEWIAATTDWTDPFGVPQVVEHDGYMVVRDDLLDTYEGEGIGTKTRGADRLIRDAKEDTVVYVSQRTGAAMPSIVHLAAKYGKKVIGFSPACKKVSTTQAVAIERGANATFLRVVAMPNLNRYTERWCQANNALFLPPGLAHESITENLVRVGLNLVEKYGEPKEMWVTCSTGTIVRALQIAMPNTKFIAYAVARNMKEGECGTAEIMTSDMEYNTPVKDELLPPFPCVRNYEAKAWLAMKDQAPKGTWFWNVATEPTLINKDIVSVCDSAREWGEDRYSFDRISKLHRMIDTTVINSEVL